MSKTEKEIKIKINSGTPPEIRKKEVIKEKKEKKVERKKKVKKNIIKKDDHSSLTAKCEIDEIIHNGYILKIIEQPTKQINADYRINDLFEYPTYNNTYEVGDIIEYSFENPLSRKSRKL